MQDLSLEKLDAIRVAIEQAATVQQIKHTLDTAVAAQVYIQQAKKGKELELKIAEYVIRAERKLGEILHAAKAAGDILRGNPQLSGSTTIKLAEIGISRDLSSRAQRIADVSKDEFEKALSNGKDAGKLSRNMFSKKHSPPPHAPKPQPARSENKDERIQRAPPVEFSEVGKLRAEIGKLKSDIRKLKAMLQEQPDAANLRKKIVDQQVEMAAMRRIMKEIAKERDANQRRVQPEYQEARRLLTGPNYRVIIKALHPDRGRHVSSAELAEAERLAVALRPLFIEKESTNR